MSIHKLTAGSGYDYLTRQVAAQDATDKGHTGLASYYAQKGETPGVWAGSGIAGIDGLEAGDVVTAEQMQALFGSGHHPLAQQRLERLAGPDLTAGDYQAVTRLGMPYKVYGSDVSAFRVEVARRIHELATELGSRLGGDLGGGSDAVVPLADRARIRTEVATEFFRTEHGRDPARGSDGAREIAATIARHSRPRTTAVAGYDLTFSPVKSVSALWAVADPATAALIERAHLAAVGDALRFLEEHALFTRTGTNGVRQVDVRGLVATSFTHRDSRAGDPDLHTHVAVANKVQTLDGRWLSIDGRVLFKANVSASETYNTALEKRLHADLGLRFTERDTEHVQAPDTANVRERAVREVVGVDPRLNERWSARRAAVVARRGELAQTFQRDHGRPPTAVESIQLAQQATLETREAKKAPRSLAEQRTTWRRQAVEVLGDEHALDAMLRAATAPTASRRATGRATARAAGEAAGGVAGGRVDAGWIDATAASIVTTLQASRSTWQVWHVRAEAQRRLRAADSVEVAAGAVDAVVGLLVDEVLDRRSVRLTNQGDGIAEPAQLRRRDDSSVYTVHGAELFTSATVLAAEQRLLAAAGRLDGATVDTHDVELALLESAANGATLNAGQTALVRGMATSGARLQLAIAPAGAGKTTALRALATAWANGGGHVIGLAPSAAAAAVLRDQISTPTPAPRPTSDATRSVGSTVTAGPASAVTDTLAKLTWSIARGDLPDWAASIGPGTLVIVDEAGMADTLTLDAVVRFVTARGGSVRLIGDDQQLAAIGAGGVLRDISRSLGALRLTELMRFTDPAEGAATLALREGAPEALGFYLDQHRVHVGDPATTTEDVFTAWRADADRGLDAIMLAPTRELVAQLNHRARAHRLARQQPSTQPGIEVTLADGNAASVGDLVITRSNERRLRLTATDWVKNGDRWTVLAVGQDGGLRVQHTRHRHTITLPAGYVSTSTELGYASTVHAAQGVSADTMHGLASGQESRQQLYTMLTRGRVANHVYVQVVGDGDPHTSIHPDTLAPPTATDILETILARDHSPVSATTQLRDRADTALLLGQATARYTDALHVAAEDHLGPDTVRRLERNAEQAVPGLTDQPAWPTLRAHLILLAAHNLNPLTALRVAAATRELDTAADPAAVIDWRLDNPLPGDAGGGPLPWLPGIPPALALQPNWGEYLTRRAELVTTLTAQVKDAAATHTPAWVTHTPGRPDAGVLADVQVWRAATQIPDSDRRPTGPPQQQKAAALWQRRLTTALHGTRAPALQEWEHVLHAAAPGIRRDDFTPTLAERLAAISRAGLDARGLLRRATALGALPDDHPAAALWWRLSRHVAPSVATDPDHRAVALTTSWLPRVSETYGPTGAEELQASPWWPALVTSIDHALQRGWTLDDLLDTHPGTDADPQLTEDLDDCQAMVWRITVLTDPPPPAEDLDEDPPPEDDRASVDHPADLHHADQELERELDRGTMRLSEAPTPEQWQQLVDPNTDPTPDKGTNPTETDTEDRDQADQVAAAVEVRLQLAAMVRDTMGPLPPDDDDVEAMVARAALWDDCPVSRERLLEINQLTLDYFRGQLPGSWADTYLHERFGPAAESATGRPAGPVATVLSGFAPGYAPAGWATLVTALRHAGVTDGEMLAAGVASRARTGRVIDRFRDRVMLPITRDGDVLGFVGRRHPDLDHTPPAGPSGAAQPAVPKYLNTADTPLFHKGAQLYGMPPWPLPGDTALVLVEGPMDAIAVTLAGGGAYVGVATLGTSLTHEQTAHLLATGRRLVVATDGDLPGRVAAERDFWILAPHGLSPAVALFPDGSDPAAVFSRQGPQALHATLQRALPLASMLIEERLTNLPQEAALQEASQVLAAQPATAWGPGSRRLASRLGVPLPNARACLAGYAEDWNRNPRAAARQQMTATREVRARPEASAEHQPVDRWLKLARELDPRLPDQSDWPALVCMLDQAHQDGHDVAATCRQLIDEKPLQDQPAQELRRRLAAQLPDHDPAFNELPFSESETPNHSRTGAAMDQRAGGVRNAPGPDPVRR
ncbi:MobF family relaxase [Humibacillus xanthopallidus]|uniref:DNA primase catalytic core n=1 Tax=Humibacillus xanthopallidus TaxID=412689 RepID=A0A543HZT4_9MICO|nr:MobF family relaxase [Humibacillus xanthopallidus]TQM63790.1 DNA primase catalytic core [Humibacillus xanthopallidus]